MSVQDVAVRASFPNEIISDAGWHRLAQRATELLTEEVRDSGVVIPALHADWSVQAGTAATPVFELRLSDIPNDPQPVLARIPIDRMQHDDSLRQDTHRLWRQLLRHRSKRQAESIGVFIKGQAGE